MNGIHPKWLRPMPRYWHDFYERDAAILDAPIRPMREKKDGDMVCHFCGESFTPQGPSGHLRKRCYDPECERERKRLNSLRSYRRKVSAA